MAATSKVMRDFRSKVPMSRKFSSHRIKSIIRYHAKGSRKVFIAKKVDMMVFLAYMLFQKRLAQRAREAAFEDKESSIHRIHIEKVAKDVLNECQG